MYCLYKGFFMFLNKQLIYWYKKYTPKFLQKLMVSIKPKWFDYYRLDKISKKNIDFSGHGETEAVKKFLGINQNEIKYFVDIGASDGVSSSSTLEFAKNDNWSGLSIEFDKIKFSKMRYVYRKYENIELANMKVTPETVIKLFEEYDVPFNFTFMNIDIDSYDLEVLVTILENSYKPDIVSIEINEKIPPPIYFKVTYDEKHFWRGDHFYGCSIIAAVSDLEKFGYKLVEFKLNNAIFVNTNIVTNVKVLDVFEAYNLGYKNYENRKNLFHYNHDVEVLQELDEQKALDFINNLFSEYKNIYELRILNNDR